MRLAPTTSRSAGACGRKRIEAGLARAVERHLGKCGMLRKVRQRDCRSEGGRVLFGDQARDFESGGPAAEGDPHWPSHGPSRPGDHGHQSRLDVDDEENRPVGWIVFMRDLPDERPAA